MLSMGVVRGISYGLFGPPEDFGEGARGLNASAVRAYVYWHQVEPEPGRFDWTLVDRLLGQAAGWGGLWLTVCSSSPWATRTPTTFLPPSPPRDPGAYARFIAELVRHCDGQVDYWQCENEPSNAGLLWAGTAQEYAELLVGFSSAVRSVSSEGRVVLGGMGHDVLGEAPGTDTWRFFETVLAVAPTAFDLVDVHCYDDPRRIPAQLASVRSMLERFDCAQRLVVGEYGGPTFFQFPEAGRAIEEAMIEAMTDLSAGPEAEPPDRRAMRTLYDRLNELPAELRQFLDDCPADVAERRNRIACREIVTRNLTAFAEGVSATFCWHLAPEVAGYFDPFSMIGLVSARLALLDFDDGALVDAQPAAATFRMLAAALRDAEGVRRITLGDRPDVQAFDVVFPPGSGRALQVLWRDADPFGGDTGAHEAFEWQWVYPDLHAADAFATALPVPAWANGRVAVPLSATPILLSSAPLHTIN